MATPRCEHCGGPMPLLSRPSLARYCSGRCRTAAHRARRRVPSEMTSRDRWVRRSARKMPLTCDGKAASSTDPATWCSYRDAVRSRAGAGLGFVLAGEGIACVDLDHCLDGRSEEHTSELQSRENLVCRLLLEKKKYITYT